MADTHSLTPDKTNPRKPDPARLGLLRLSIAKLGFLMPVFADKATGLLLSGHQRQTVSKELGLTQIPVQYIDIKQDDIAGVNILFNRTTNDFGAFDTGAIAREKLDLETVIAAAEALPDADPERPFAIDCKMERVVEIAAAHSDKFNDKAANQAQAIMRMGVYIPAVVSASGMIVNGVHRIFAGLAQGMTEYPVVRIPDEIATVALNFLNYLSMDFHVDSDFEKLIRYSAYRRPQNNRGVVPKSYRFWANGERTLLDRDSYGPEYWTKFRDIHGKTLLDFGAGLGKVAPYLRTKEFDAHDFEPYRIDPDSESGKPSPAYSKQQARRFLESISDPRLKFNSIFLSSVLNSVPFAKDRLCVLAIVHALCSRDTVVYGTCRDISDFNYEYGGIRKANYFTFDTEAGVRVGDVMRNPKIQKFHSQEEAAEMFKRFWKDVQFWPGGNVFYWRVAAPMGFRPDVVASALELEFDLPYDDGSTMGLVDVAKQAFSKRLGVTIK
jgi:hypothetical protein